MTPPAAAARRLALVPAAPRDGRTDAAVRRFRLARLRLEGRPAPRDRRSGAARRIDD
jgi:hypothetical protein